MALIIGSRLGIPYLDTISRILDYFLTSPWRSDISTTQLEKPILFISGSEDELIPSKQMQSLFETCASPKKEFFEVIGGDHNGTWQVNPALYLQKVQHFLVTNLEKN